jgi:hypothetical protein
MKKTSVLLGIGVLSLMLVSFVGKGECEKSKEHKMAQHSLTELQKNFTTEILSTQNTEPISIDEISFIELEEEIELGFDTEAYLPEGFNAYKGMKFTVSDFEVIEVEEDIDLGFNTANYLPKGFNPYEGMEFEIEEILADIVLIEEEIDLGFDTAEYLPVGFDAYAR